MRSPILEYFYSEGFLYATRVRTRDTLCPFGPDSLDSHSKTFLGLGKCDTISRKDKANMLRTFHERTEDAYGYAIVDVLNTLLVYEEMQRRDRAIYEQFGIQSAPPMRATLGGRVNEFITSVTQNICCSSTQLFTGRALTSLMEKGGISLFAAHPGASRYGTQTGRVHGGLLYCRSPTRFWHVAPGMLRDVDMSGCYEKSFLGKICLLGPPRHPRTG